MNALLRGLLWTSRTSVNAIVTAWQCVGQWFESPQLHLPDQAALLPEIGLRRPWLQFSLQLGGPYPAAAGAPVRSAASGRERGMTWP